MASEGTAEDAGAADTPKEPSFQGRLQLNDFMFVSSNSKSNSSGAVPSPSTATMRRSSRIAASPPAGALRPPPSSLPSASSAPRPATPPAKASRTRKRKAEDPEDSATATTTDANNSRINKTTSSAFFPASASSAPSPTKRAGGRHKGRASAGYAPPSTYAHLPLLPDAVAPRLLILFIGLNPGVETARTGHAYAHPTNLFWRLLHRSGITPEPCAAREDRGMPRRYALGFTNIVARPSRSGAELSRAEMDDGVAALHQKCARWRPEVACVVGKGIWESVCRVRARQRGRRPPGPADFRYGWQDGEDGRMGVVNDESAVSEGGVGPWPGSRVFVATSTSGLAASLRPEEKERIWKELGDWCVARRKEREVEAEEEKRREVKEEKKEVKEEEKETAPF